MRFNSPVSGRVILALLIILFCTPAAFAQSGSQASDNKGLSLQTATPEEGFALALTLSRKGVTETQTKKETLHAERPEYSTDADSLIAASHVVAVHFQTIAAANNYWRD